MNRNTPEFLILTKKKLGELKQVSSEQPSRGHEQKQSTEARRENVSNERSQKWTDTLQGNMKKRLAAKRERFEAKEREEKHMQDQANAENLVERQKRLESAEKKLFRQSEEARNIDRAYLTDHVLKERRAQIEANESKKHLELSKCKENLDAIQLINRKHMEDLQSDKTLFEEGKQKYKSQILDQIKANSLRKDKFDYSNASLDNLSPKIGRNVLENDKHEEIEKNVENCRFNLELAKNKTEVVKKLKENDLEEEKNNKEILNQLEKFKITTKDAENEIIRKRQEVSEAMAKNLALVKENDNKTKVINKNCKIDSITENILNADDKRFAKASDCSRLAYKKTDYLEYISNLNSKKNEQAKNATQNCEKQAQNILNAENEQLETFLALQGRKKAFKCALDQQIKDNAELRKEQDSKSKKLTANDTREDIVARNMSSYLNKSFEDARKFQIEPNMLNLEKSKLLE